MFKLFLFIFGSLEITAHMYHRAELHEWTSTTVHVTMLSIL